MTSTHVRSAPHPDDGNRRFSPYGTPLLAHDHDDHGHNHDDDARNHHTVSAHNSSRGRTSQTLHSHRRDPSITKSKASSSPNTPRHSTALPSSMSRRGSNFRSQSPLSPIDARLAARKKYTYAAFFLVLSLITFTVQTELAAFVQHDLGWNKAYCMLWITHGSWSLLWPVQLGILRFQKRKMPWGQFWRQHVWLLRTTGQMVERQTLDVLGQHTQRGHHAAGAVRGRLGNPWPYLLRTTAFIACALTVAGLSWYIAVNMTTPSDLTAIYNCSAFFAYAFSVPLLREKLRLDKSAAVGIAVLGVLVVAYGDTKAKSTEAVDVDVDVENKGQGGLDESGSRFLGNLIIGAGSVLYGLYEVLYKRYACPPDGCSPGRGMIFANTFGSLIGCFTLFILWIPLPLLHWTGIETFSLPTGQTAFYLWLSVVMNATFAGCFLVLISLTSPVLSSVASLLTIFIVAVSDWVLKGDAPSFAAMMGGLMIVLAFLMLSWSTWREMTAQAPEQQEGMLPLAVSDSEDEESVHADMGHDYAGGEESGRDG